MNVIIGHTGLVGSALSKQLEFEYKFNRSNINEFNTIPDDCNLFLSCLPAEKWKINQNITSDIDNMMSILDIIKNKKYSKVYLISTIDVYLDTELFSNEDTIPKIKKLGYGSNRYLFELLVKEYLKTDYLNIIRLPALFNDEIKKNVLYDLLNNNSVEKINSNSSYQWYNLDNLVDDIEKFCDQKEVVYNFFTEPVETEKIIQLFPQHKNVVSRSDKRVMYDYKTRHNKTGYIKSKEKVFYEIKQFVEKYESSSK